MFNIKLEKISFQNLKFVLNSDIYGESYGPLKFDLIIISDLLLFKTSKLNQNPRKVAIPSATSTICTNKTKE